MIAPEEEQIRRLFETARQVEESQAPGFQATVAGARRRAATRGHMKVLAAVTVMVLFAILSVLVITGTKKEEDLISSRAAVYWESPTEAYLSVPGDGILTLVATATTNRADRSER
jgi:hypothetical protein